jgi:4-hydroxymandelate oxidase
VKGPHAPPLRGSLPPEGADPAWGGPAPDRVVPVTLADHERLAQERTEPSAWAYLSGGAADEITLRANQHAWQQIPLRPRVLRPLAGSHTWTELMGRTLAHPIMVAPMAYQRLAHPHGEAATALAAAAQGAGLVLSTQSSTRLEDVARLYLGEPGRGPLWFQLYKMATRSHMRDLVQRAEYAGYEALVLTVDAPVHGARDRERRAGFTLPPGIAAVNLASPDDDGSPSGPVGLDILCKQAATWDDVAWLRMLTPLPLVLKGITHPEDAQLAVEAGAAAIIVSNHGGRTLDTVPATAHLLPEIVAAVDGRCPVLVDGGIRRGTDVLKAMAMGASAVLVGRPVIHGLANAGAAGVAHVIRLLRDELAIAMALCGCSRLSDANRSLLS